MTYSTMPCSATVMELLTDAGTKPYPTFEQQIEADDQARRRTVDDLAWDAREEAARSGRAAKAKLFQFVEAVINADELDAIVRAACSGDRQAVGEQMEQLIDRIAHEMVEG